MFVGQRFELYVYRRQLSPNCLEFLIAPFDGPIQSLVPGGHLSMR